MSKYGYLEVIQRVPLTSRLRESAVYVSVVKCFVTLFDDVIGILLNVELKGWNEFGLELVFSTKFYGK